MNEIILITLTLIHRDYCYFYQVGGTRLIAWQNLELLRSKCPGLLISHNIDINWPFIPSKLLSLECFKPESCINESTIIAHVKN